VLVSNFTVGKTPNLAANREVAYCLQVTNLEELNIEFLFECYVSREPRPGEDGIAYWSAHDRGWDLQSEPGPLRFSRPRTGTTAVLGRLFVTVGAGLSTIIRLWGPRASGYVNLRVPPGRTHDRFRLAPQLERPVRVLLLASHESQRPTEQRALFRAHGASSDLNYIIADDYSSASVSISTGKAENEIDAEDWKVRALSDFWDDLRDGPRAFEEIRGARDLPEAEHAAILLDLLSGLDASREELENINQLLRDSGASIRLEPS
jgi:hypothetical protein